MEKNRKIKQTFVESIIYLVYLIQNANKEEISPLAVNIQTTLKVKTSIGNAPISKNEMEALITNHVKEYVLTNTWW